MIYHQDMQESIRREKILHNPDDRSRSVIGNVDNEISTQSNLIQELLEHLNGSTNL